MTNLSDDDGPKLDYVLGHSEQELDRLGTQARLIDPITRQLFREAGIVSGMRVLDVGSGAGDVAFLTAELVGESGEVVGVDRSTVAIAAATARAAARSLRNVSFHEGDPAVMAFERYRDAHGNEAAFDVCCRGAAATVSAASVGRWRRREQF